MKIVITTGSLYNRNGGPYFSVRSLAKAFLLNGHEVILIGSKDDSNLPDMPEGYVNLTNEFSKLTVISMNKIGPYKLHFTPGLYNQLKKIEAIDILFIQGVWMWNCWITFLFGYLTSIKSVVSVRGEFNDKGSLSELKKRILMPWIRFMLNNVDYVHVLNELEKSNLKSYRIKNKINVIPNGVFLNEIGDSKPQDKIVLYLGRLHPLKNLVNLIDAWNNLNLSDWQLIIAGEGEKEFEIELRQKAQNKNSIFFYGHANENQKKELLSKASWFILPSFAEGMPVAVLEAMAFNIPCIISEACNLNDFVEEGSVIKSGTNSFDIAAAINKSVNLSNLELEIMQRKMNKRLHENYSWLNIAETMLKCTFQ